MKIKNVNTNVNFSDVSFGKNDMIGQSLKKFNQIDSKVDIYDFENDESIANEEIKNIFENYDLSDEQLLKLSRVCIQEQGTVKGAAAEASLMANLFELRGGEYKDKTGAEGLYDFVRNSGWFYKASDYMDNGSDENKASQDVIDAVKDVLVNGKRILPKYVNEHDGTYGLECVTNDGEVIDKNNPDEYISNVSKCKQDPSMYDDPITWTYYCHPDKGSDPFGYDSEELREKYGDGHYDFDTGEYVDK